MELVSNKWIAVLIVCCLSIGVSCNSVEKKIYVNLNYTVPCVRLLNATHQIGCQSSLSGNVGVLHVLESEDNLEWVLTSGPNPPYLVILESWLFNRSIMMKLKNSSSRVAGVAVVASNVNPPKGFSPHTTCPNENTGVYLEDYDPAFAHCNVTVWNPLGNGLSYEEFDFPIFSLKDDNETQVIRQCYFDHNRAVNGSTPQYPLCAMQLYSHMSAVTDTSTCMRRNEKNTFSISPEMVCDPLGDFNIWASTRPLNTTSKGHKMWESVVLAAARLDSRSFFFDIASGAESGVSGFVTLLAAAHALRNATQESQPNRTILYTFFQGETFDYIGSSRMVYDMQNNEFIVDLDNIHSVLEVGQVGLRNNDKLWLHSDPVSRKNSSVNELVRNLIGSLQLAAGTVGISLEEINFSQPLPPSSFQRFLRARPVPGVVIEAHRSGFTNRFYESMYDNAEYLNISYPSNLTLEEQLDFVTDTATPPEWIFLKRNTHRHCVNEQAEVPSENAGSTLRFTRYIVITSAKQSLAEVATMVARALYLQAGGAEAQLDSITADAQIVSRMLYGFLVRSNNSWFQQIIPSELVSHLTNRPTNFYVGVSGQTSEPTLLVKYLLANLTGSNINITQDNCQNQREHEDDNESKHMYTYMWFQSTASPNSTQQEGFCLRSTVHLSKALSPAFDLNQYTSKDYSTWTESRWKTIKGRIFLVASHDLEMLTLGVGIGVLLTSLLLTYIVSSKADILFSSSREPSSATY